MNQTEFKITGLLSFLLELREKILFRSKVEVASNVIIVVDRQGL